MKLTIVFQPGEDGWIVAECCISQGKTRDEAIANIKEAIELCIEVRKEKGWPIFADTDEVEVAL